MTVKILPRSGHSRLLQDTHCSPHPLNPSHWDHCKWRTLRANAVSRWCERHWTCGSWGASSGRSQRGQNSCHPQSEAHNPHQGLQSSFAAAAPGSEEVFSCAACSWDPPRERRCSYDGFSTGGMSTTSGIWGGFLMVFIGHAQRGQKCDAPNTAGVSKACFSPIHKSSPVPSEHLTGVCHIVNNK